MIVKLNYAGGSWRMPLRTTSGRPRRSFWPRKPDVLLLMDESNARAFAETWSKSGGTLYAFLRGGVLDTERAKGVRLQLVGKGFRVDPRLLVGC